MKEKLTLLLKPSEFKCNICFELLLKPCSLACGHLFCHQCLDDLSQYEKTNKTCPYCRDTIENGFPIHCRGLEEMLEKLILEL